MRIRQTYNERNDVVLFHGDCVKLLRGIADGAAQLVVTSPPYNVGKEYEDNLTIENYLKLQRTVIEECLRVTRTGGSICWQVGNHVNGHGQLVPLDLLLHPLFCAYAETDDLRLRNRVVWHFEHGLNCRTKFSGRHQTILWYTNGNNCFFDLDKVRRAMQLLRKEPLRRPEARPLFRQPAASARCKHVVRLTGDLGEAGSETPGWN